MVNSFISLGHHEISHGEISLGDHEISHGEISPGYQENLLVNKFPFFTPFIDGVLQRGHFQHFKHTVDRWPTN